MFLATYFWVIFIIFSLFVVVVVRVCVYVLGGQHLMGFRLSGSPPCFYTYIVCYID